MADLPETAHPAFGKVAEAWEKWESWLAPSYTCFNKFFFRNAGLAEGQRVLDLGCGSGFITRLIAQIVGPKGSVVGVDLAPEMIDVARRKQRLTSTQMQFELSDINHLNFADGSFDAATARFCFMFVPDIRTALREAHRVLRKGGRLAASVWSDPEKNPLPRNVLKEYFELPISDPEVPGHFRFAKEGDLANLFSAIGFANVQDRTIRIREVFEDGKHYLEHILESSALWGSLLKKLSGSQYEEATQKLIAAAEKYEAHGKIRILREARVVHGMKI